MFRGEGFTLTRAARAANVSAALVAAMIAAAVVSVLVYTAVAGGAVGPVKAEPVTVDDARDEFSATLHATQELVGVTWEVRDDPFPRSCAELVASGQQIPALRIGAPATDPVAAADAVETAWAEWGYRVARADGPAGVVELHATGELGEYLMLRVGSTASTLQGESACAPTP